MTTSKRISSLAALFGLLAASTYVIAQPQPKPQKPPADAAGDCSAMKECPMMEAGMSMSTMTVQVENTKQGAVLKLTAKVPADAPKIQQMAQKMAKHMEAGCGMMHGAGMMHGPGHGEGHGPHHGAGHKH